MLLNNQKSIGKRVINEINIVPYVDVMLVLLVIFMVVTPLAIQGIETVSYTHLTLPTNGTV